jgi:NAD(P)-dependent dehydrogenase (short-subunit alcohol dehydrogenase family)
MSEIPQAPAILITGASTGIGWACALDLDARGFHVFAGVRRQADADRLAAAASDRLRPLLLDVTDPAAVRSAAETIATATDAAGLAGLVNNAGIVVPGPLECLPTSRLREQLEVNVLGTHAVTQAMLPLLRAGRGRIVIIGSISGRVAPPYLGAYAASKYALEAMADALRLELRRWGLSVSLVEPDSVATALWDKYETRAEQLGGETAEATARLYEDDLQAMRIAGRRLDRMGMPVDRVVAAVRHALLARRPKTRYPLGFRTRLATSIAPLLPDRLRDWFVMRFMGL